MLKLKYKIYYHFFQKAYKNPEEKPADDGSL